MGFWRKKALPPEQKARNARWDRFIGTICFRPLAALSTVQRTAVLCFWYDAEMNSGGHSGYFDCYPDTDPEELARAIAEVSHQDIADNYRMAVSGGEKDGFQAADTAYYDFSPSLSEYLMGFVEQHSGEIFA